MRFRICGKVKLGFYSDIHSNADALIAVHRSNLDVDQWYCLGDVVGYGDQPNEACEFLRINQIPTVCGNHDAMVLGKLPCPAERDSRYRLSKTRAELSIENYDWLNGLPDQRNIQLSDTSKVALRHANDKDLTTYLHCDTPNLEAYLPSAFDVMIVGHTHRCYIAEFGRGSIINCGSVGQPRSGEPGAHFLTWEPSEGWQLKLATYDIGATVERMKANHVWDQFYDRVARPNQAT
jgi:predicted phosphodiesterase